LVSVNSTIIKSHLLLKDICLIRTNMNNTSPRYLIICWCIIMITGLQMGCSKQLESQVIVYTSWDRIFSQPILEDFEKKTGIRVLAVYDTEATKAVGLANRLMAERHNPKADVYWNSEITQTLRLKQKGILAPYRSPSAADIPDSYKDQKGYWTGFAGRLRVLIYNKDKTPPKSIPTSITDLTRPEFRGRVAFANPAFGSTHTHITALSNVWGAEQTKIFLSALKANETHIVSGNSMARDRIGLGDLWVSIVDIDDYLVGKRRGLPIEMKIPDQEPGGLGVFIVPSTVGLISGASNLAEAKKFIDFLLSRETESKLSFSGSGQIPLRPNVDTPPELPNIKYLKVMNVDYTKLVDALDATENILKGY